MYEIKCFGRKYLKNFKNRGYWNILPLSKKMKGKEKLHIYCIKSIVINFF